LQTISLLAYLRESRGVKGPHIVIVPKSVVGNWIREFNKWCPSIKAIKMGGTKEERQIFINNELPRNPINGKYPFDVLVTSYEGLLKEKGRFSKVEWNYLIIDEAHRIKNENSSLSLAVRTMKTQFRLLITGTPLQNNLRELWALLNFLMTDIFGDAEQFDEWFSLSDESGKENVIKKLHTILRPFMLRRVKSDVAKELPPKKETKLYVGLTEMQRLYYVHCLMKDAHELNKLGGPDRSRLLNVLMQLRKVCNHPYLFDGAEKGPPYIDGPHIWENSGKMQLLHKLLPKLQAQQSRVLIFSQMTRVLDILEDYLRLLQFEYCRIDGNTTGERRDAQVDEFNKDGSTKFVFLLSTRAGGLGINLATADIVIIFDSDWNPQVDLQAMDRAHRIGQTKPVQVFRFITEGTVEEKIIERADRKLFLDAAVIQQGRLAEQNAALDKNDLMKMVRFGADQIVSGKGGTYTDEDIDALIARGEEKTTAMQAQLETNAQHSLANFTLLADDEATTDTFEFGGVNYRDKGTVGNFINLPQRQRKRNYDLNSPENSGGIVIKKSDLSKKKRKGPVLYDFQLFDMERINEMYRKEDELLSKKESDQNLINTLRQEAIHAPTYGSGVASGRSKEELLHRAEFLEKNLSQYELSDAEKLERDSIYAEGFPDWSRKDFKAFCTSLERHGRYDFNNICQEVVLETGKDRAEIARYFVAFWMNYQRILEWGKILEKIERGEKKIQRLRQIREVIHEKVERHLEDTFSYMFGPDGTVKNDEPLPTVSELLHYSWPKMKINYGFSNRGKGYQEEEDAFLVCMMYRHGYGAAERIRMEIRRAWQFRFDWYFKSRTAADIQKRCDILVKIVEREIEDLHKKEAMEETMIESEQSTLDIVGSQTEA
jgi:SWI/SNF-related matrix-associated actin-dependent regulator of chromatin subfamily A member 5